VFSTLRIMWADSGYDGRPLARYARAAAAITVEVVKRISPHSFQVLRCRWVVERTFGWLMRYRRLAGDYERTVGNSEAMIYWATILIMTRRLVRCENGRPPARRWGGERALPVQPGGQAPRAVNPRGTGQESGDEIGQHHSRRGESVRCGDVEDTLIHQHDVTGLTAQLGDTNARAFNDGAVIEVPAEPIPVRDGSAP
jgi:hypothetical protein